MASIDSVTVAEDAFRMKPEGTAMATMAMERGLLSKDVFQVPSQSVVIETEKVRCECCKLIEDCTPAYIAHVKDLYYGRWICGLCEEAVKEEQRQIQLSKRNEEGLEDALREHMKVCIQFNSRHRIGSPVADISAAVRKLLRRNTDTQFTSRSVPSSPNRQPPLDRVNSCCSALPRVPEAPL
ncbi:hypothetical protein KP509_33G033900 [Ceratopteris richardii]|uniref:Uncharacterized protein n=1 Tax=Ceratopteris richardii TaxID=49495 RepID=A0A8T2QQC9_CERRI|nr:hypothetical protein KP509_33G033900 [Ceratopteris richardii]